jgi:hypothetical protein
MMAKSVVGGYTEIAARTQALEVEVLQAFEPPKSQIPRRKSK